MCIVLFHPSFPTFLSALNLLGPGGSSETQKTSEKEPKKPIAPRGFGDGKLQPSNVKVESAHNVPHLLSRQRSF